MARLAPWCWSRRLTAVGGRLVGPNPQAHPDRAVRGCTARKFRQPRPNESWVSGGALNLIGGDTLYGRYWGCAEEYRFLHFEACYYRAIDFAIARGFVGDPPDVRKSVAS